jgi:hypothetical protein
VLSARRDALRRSRTTDPAAAVAAAIVLPPVVNMFEAADALSPVVSQSILGTTVQVHETRDGWALAETPDRYQGWMRDVACASAPPFRGHGHCRAVACSPTSIASRTSPAPRRCQRAAAARFASSRTPGSGSRCAADGRAGQAAARGAGLNPPAVARPAGQIATAMRFWASYLWGGRRRSAEQRPGPSTAHGSLFGRSLGYSVVDARRAATRWFLRPAGKQHLHVGINWRRRFPQRRPTGPVVRVDSLGSVLGGLVLRARRADWSAGGGVRSGP